MTSYRKEAESPPRFEPDILAPSPEEQAGIISALDREQESIHSYCVSKEWYQRWRSYIGLPDQTGLDPSSLRHQGGGSNSTPNTEKQIPRAPSSERRSSSAGSKTPSVDNKVPFAENKASPNSKSSHQERKRLSSGSKPLPSGESRETSNLPPISMNLNSDDGNVFVGEEVWKCIVGWYGVDDLHELDRRAWMSERKEFEICRMSPYCGLLENPIKTFDVAEDCGYVEMQLRRVFRVPSHRSSRLWVCEKSRHSRFHLLLDRNRELCFPDSVDQQRVYILALEVSNLDNSWPTHVPGNPTGSFERYHELVRSVPAKNSTSYWEAELTETLDTVFGGMTNELRETTAGIVATTKCVTTLMEKDIHETKQVLQNKIEQFDDNKAELDQISRHLRQETESLKSQRSTFAAERDAFERERQKFAEELVRMHTINVIQEGKIKLNVGGHVFMTSTITLKKDPESMLAAMFSGRHAFKQEDDGSYFLDRDGTHFRYILNYLRDGHFRSGSLPTDASFLNELYTEAEYYQLTGLMALLVTVLRSVADTDYTQDGNSSKVGHTAATGCTGRTGLSPGKRIQRKVNTQQK